SLEEAAQHIFAALRKLDTLPVDLIIAELMPDEGLGRAINDRLRRAAV
ncbi:MAG TPA: Sua5 family C-terminal domain-containing protein, partial [Bacteroidia bacterium]|nr:Sua5 family C-terminal domain-containing protein [Bacteroidia bacterium]